MKVAKTVKHRDLWFVLWMAVCSVCVSVIGVEPYFAFCLLIFALYLKVTTRLPYSKKINFLYLAFILTIFIFSIKIITSNNISLFYAPVPAVAILVTVLFNDLQLAIIMTVLSSVLAGISAGGSLSLSVLFMVGGGLGAILTWKARRRSSIIKSGLAILVVEAACLWTIDQFHVFSTSRYYDLALNSLLCPIFVVGALPIFEYLFKVVTNISLLELTDFNHPVLKKMVLEAPGTYHHSLIVGNLAEAAAEKIGANSLLARVGAYYHDIGKLDKAEYFSENQIPGASVHEHLTPSMSKMVIMNHVKEGIEVARRNRLNPIIVDFISQHHGTSLVFYFYKKAMEDTAGNNDVEEEVFRYPGPKPQTKEAAIVMLADSVEAATRSLAEPLPTRIDEVVHKIINNKFIDGQLDECELKLSEIEKIADVFIHVLGGIYHSRINYPEPDENSHKKQAKVNTNPKNSDTKS